MKRILFISAILMIISGIATHAQDVITMKTGEDIEAKILEITPTEISYKKYSNPEGPTFVIKKNEVLMITYENGEREIIKQTDVSTDTWRQTPEGIVPGMRYRDYKDKYTPSDYSSQSGDPYIPAVSGVCSFLIPGLGQMICGEVGRGFAWLGSAAGCCVLTGIGAGVVGSAVSGMQAGEDGIANPGSVAIGSLMMIAGSIGLLTVDIMAIVDGVKVAKIKNMYTRDVRNMSSLDIKLNPYIASTAASSANPTQSPVLGMSLQVRF